MLNPSDIPSILRKARYRGGDFAELYCQKTLETTISFDDKRVESIVSGADQGVGLRLIDDLNTIYGFTNNMSKNSLLDLASRCSSALSGPALEKDINLKSQMAQALFPISKDPFQIPTQNKVQLCEKVSQYAWKKDPRITQVEVSYWESQTDLQIANSLGELVEQTSFITSFAVSISVSDGDDLYSSTEMISGHQGYEIFDQNDVFSLVDKACHKALQNLTADRVQGGNMMVVLSSQAGGTIIHEAVGHGLEADLVYDKMSIYAGQLGQQVASPLITVIDDATLPQMRGSYSFDDEGVPAQKTVLIENGILKDFMCDRLTAMKMNRHPTGNGRRQTYEYRPVVRMTNTFVAPGKDNPDDILKSVDQGLFVKSMGGGQVNTVNGDFVFDCTEAYLIEKGEITTPVKNASLIGNGGEIIQSIDRVGDDLDYSIGTCGKDNQSVPISDGIPTLRIPNIIVGGQT